MADESDFQLQNSLQAIEYSRECIRTVVLINGGAAVALVGFIGGSTRVVDAAALRGALFLFCSGVTFAAFAALFGYVAQTEFALHNQKLIQALASSDTRARIVTAAGVLLVIMSLLCFFAGIHYAGLSLFPTP